MKKQFREYARPWKLVSLMIGVSFLIGGAYYYEAPDWDVSISFIMAICAYLTAPWSMRTLVKRRWKYYPLMIFYAWFTVDGCYWIYWSVQDPKALEMMRDVNFPASLSLYSICGLIWYYQGTLKRIIHDIRHFRLER